MSNKAQLQTNNTALDGYIARINAAKEVAASLPEAGGGGVVADTCTVQVTGDAYYTSYSATIYTNGEISYITKYGSYIAGTDFTIPNVVVGTAVTICTTDKIGAYYWNIQNGSFICHDSASALYVEPNTANDTTVVTIMRYNTSGGSGN